MALGIRKGDVVRVVKGSDRGKQGRVIGVDAERGRVRVEKVRVHKRHLKPGRRGAARSGGILEEEGFIDASNVALVDGKGAASRTRTELRDGRRVRVFVTTGEPVPDPRG
jgi:large subunit ribosomal protein L24